MAAITSLGVFSRRKQRLIGVQAEVVLECGIGLGQHLNVRARTKELLTGACQDDDVNIFVHARLKNGVVQLPVHRVAVGVGGRIVQLENGNSRVNSVVDQLASLNRAGERCYSSALLLILARPASRSLVGVGEASLSGVGSTRQSPSTLAERDR